jgi:hypothetical protein
LRDFLSTLLEYSNGPTKCVLFFGDSFTFGAGVPDDKTMPYQVAVKSNFRTFNLGVGGYGPHHMLAALEHDLVRTLVDCDRQLVTHVIYQAIWQHGFRAAGLQTYSRRDPRYEVDENGNVTYRGHFDDGLMKVWHVVATQAIKSEVYRRLMGVPEWQFRRLKDDDLELYAGVVVRARVLVHASFPCATFHVLFWDTNDDESNAILDRLSVLGLNLHHMSAILPNYDYADGGSTYKIHPLDGHPNALAYELMADYVVETILPNMPRCDRST